MPWYRAVTSVRTQTRLMLKRQRQLFARAGLKSSSVLTIAFKVQPPALGKGGSENIFSGKALEFIHKKVGVGSAETWELCYSAKKHGWSSRTFRSRCYGKGPLFYFQKSLSTYGAVRFGRSRRGTHPCAPRAPTRPTLGSEGAPR